MRLTVVSPLLVSLVLAIAVTPAAAQVPSGSAPSAAPASRLGVLAAQPGEWEGDAWYIIGPGPEGRRILRQKEWIGLEAGGTVVTVKGHGTEKMPDGSVVTRHEAFGIFYTDHSGKPAMRAFLANGQWMDMDFTVLPDGYDWSMEHPQAGRVRYEMRLADGTWVEKGFATRDGGKTWNQFMEMTLKRVKPSA